MTPQLHAGTGAAAEASLTFVDPRRFKANMEKLHSGNVIKVSEVVRDLWRRDRDKGLSAGEKRMLAKARAILIAELALAEQTPEDKAEIMLDEVLAS